jgi:hypothetical protein
MILLDKLNTEFACNALESLARQQACPSPELAAIELAAHALLFIGTPQPPTGDENVRLENVSPLVVMREWSSHGHSFEATIASWKDDVARHGTEEQRAFISYIEESQATDFTMPDDKHNIETRPFADNLPQPDQALRIIETLAQRYPSDSLNRTRVDFAIHTLRYIVDHDQVAALGKFLDDCGKRHEPFDNA